MKEFNKIFVTVGTTQFEELVDVLLSHQILGHLQKHNCKKLTIQLGNGKEISDSAIRMAQQSYGIQCEFYHLKPTILDDIMEADLVISHAGAGSCIEILNAKKLLLVVVNERLMDNHQIELAEQLHKDGYLLFCTPATLGQSLGSLQEDLLTLKEYEKGNVREFVRQLDLLMGF